MLCTKDENDKKETHIDYGVQIIKCCQRNKSMESMEEFRLDICYYAPHYIMLNIDKWLNDDRVVISITGLIIKKVGGTWV